MTDVASVAPAAQSADAVPVQPAAPADQSTVDEIKDRAAEVAADVKEKAGEALDQAGEAISEAADRVATATREAAGTVVTRLRNNASLPASRGKTVIANEVVEKIAGIAAREVPGVYDLGGDTARLLTSLKERIGMGAESKSQGVSVKLNGTQADLSLTLVVEYGFVIAPVCDQVREKAITAVESLLGLEVTNVDILVDDVHMATAEPAEPKD